MNAFYVFCDVICDGNFWINFLISNITEDGHIRVVNLIPELR